MQNTQNATPMNNAALPIAAQDTSQDTTRLIGKIVSAYYLVTGIGFLVSRDFFATMVAHVGSDPVLINLSGMVHFFIGMTILVVHFKWRGLLQIAVTLLGFAFLSKGILLIAVPEMTLQADTSTEVGLATIIGFIAVGLVLGYASFVKSR